MLGLSSDSSATVAPLMGWRYRLSVRGAVSVAGVVGEKKSCDVDLSCCIYRQEHTEAASSYIIRCLETGSRTIVNYNDLPEMELEEFSAVVERFREEACWFHFEVSFQLKSLAWCSRDTGVILTRLLAGKNPRHNAPVHTVSKSISSYRQNQCRGRETWPDRLVETC